MIHTKSNSTNNRGLSWAMTCSAEAATSSGLVLTNWP